MIEVYRNEDLIKKKYGDKIKYHTCLINKSINKIIRDNKEDLIVIIVIDYKKLTSFISNLILIEDGWIIIKDNKNELYDKTKTKIMYVTPDEDRFKKYMLKIGYLYRYTYDKE